MTLYQTGTDGSEESIEPWGEYDEITGSTYPADIFIDYMNVAHEGLEVEDFPPAAELLATRGGTVPQTAKPTGEPEEEATTTPTAPPEATASPTPQPTTEPTPQGTPQPDGQQTEPPDSQKPGNDSGGKDVQPGETEQPKDPQKPQQPEEQQQPGEPQQPGRQGPQGGVG